MSNFFRSNDPGPSSGDTGAGTVCRPIQKPEIESALRLILANDDGLASDDAVLDFLSFAVQRKIDLNQIWIAALGDTLVWALLPIDSPGRTMLIITPPDPRRHFADSARILTEQLCAHCERQGTHLAQFLLDPNDQAARELYESCGFEVLAELIYLSRPVREPPAPPILPAEMQLLQYNEQTHADFARAIQRSYEGSLDCPALNGRRDIEDVIRGHKAAGEFDPSCWHLLIEQGEPRGVLILGLPVHSESVELVYLGLSPELRRRGIGDLMIQLALTDVARQRRIDLSLAVDSRNTPALKLYYRQGFRRVGSRIAMVRDLRTAADALSRVR